MGSTTYEWILDHEFADKRSGEVKWPDVDLARSSRTGGYPSSPTRVEFTSADVATVHEEMVAAAGGRNVWIVGGGDLAASSPMPVSWTR